LITSNANKIAFCFPGQGSIEAGMGLDIAEAVPAAMDVYQRGSAASGSTWSTSASVAPPTISRHRCQRRRSSRRRSPSWPPSAPAGSADFVVGHSVGEFAAMPLRLDDGGGGARARP
jgi:malonyl CoA-acyl carrier protein transacylase